ncbi:MAG: HAD family hydrolase [Lachnospiraceae bacterium]|nr:HAD family hydrolase [Lachnospiraceae bacterium]
MKKNIGDYKLYVFDLDGTLYDQPKLRAIMAGRLMGYYILHPFSAGDLLILQHFRKVKDGWTGNSSEEEIIKKVAADRNTDIDRVRRIVRKWIYDDPLTAVAMTADRKLIGWIKSLREKGKKVVILSDYPTGDKLSAMGVSVDGQYSPDDPRIDELKPSPKGLMVIMEDTGIDADDILMIGDRMEKDGMSAVAAGVDHLILNRRVAGRKINEI